MSKTNCQKCETRQAIIDELRRRLSLVERDAALTEKRRAANRALMAAKRAKAAAKEVAE
jgi:hypothetical protein